jgi:heme/copper-type cytochrome/quinol oxidase subunit 2
MELAKLFTFICFAIWAIGTIAIIVFATFFYEKLDYRNKRKINIRHPFDLILMLTIFSWISMWCFRSMY